MRDLKRTVDVHRQDVIHLLRICLCKVDRHNVRLANVVDYCNSQKIAPRGLSITLTQNANIQGRNGGGEWSICLVSSLGEVNRDDFCLNIRILGRCSSTMSACQTP
jgi:hypothetical protein